MCFLFSRPVYRSIQSHRVLKLKSIAQTNFPCQKWRLESKCKELWVVHKWSFDVMVTIQTKVDVSDGKEKFSFARISRKLKFSKRTKQSTDKEKLPADKKKFSIRNFFRSSKKQPEVHFDSGYGKRWKMTFTNFTSLNFLRITKLSIQQNSQSCPKRRRMRKRKIDFSVVLLTQ